MAFTFSGIRTSSWNCSSSFASPIRSKIPRYLLEGKISPVASFCYRLAVTHFGVCKLLNFLGWCFSSGLSWLQVIDSKWRLAALTGSNEFGRGSGGFSWV